MEICFVESNVFIDVEATAISLLSTSLTKVIFDLPVISLVYAICFHIEELSSNDSTYFNFSGFLNSGWATKLLMP